MPRRAFDLCDLVAEAFVGKRHEEAERNHGLFQGRRRLPPSTTTHVGASAESGDPTYWRVTAAQAWPNSVPYLTWTFCSLNSGSSANLPLALEN